MRVRFDERSAGSVVDLQIDISEASILTAAVTAVAQRLRAVVQRFELRPRRDALDARIVLSPRDESHALDRTEQAALVSAVLEAFESAFAAPEPA
jgi:hypothetical protein